MMMVAASAKFEGKGQERAEGEETCLIHWSPYLLTIRVLLLNGHRLLTETGQMGRLI